jgi:hypothetical protein
MDGMANTSRLDGQYLERHGNRKGNLAHCHHGRAFVDIGGAGAGEFALVRLHFFGFVEAMIGNAIYFT